MKNEVVINKIAKWYEKNRVKIIDGIDSDSTGNRFNEEDVIAFIKMFPYNMPLELVSTELFIYMSKQLFKECYKKRLSKEVFIKELKQVASFCCLNGYSKKFRDEFMKMFPEYLLDSVLWND
ncbi:hypothetical protein JXA27_06710 [Aerococcaceae bacterium zg-B36]|uniref:hypothetical protein n=1 Tax=Aerococcaceae bacterium zg-252 TaxID=2796928 RepID=UPI001BD89D89|nr:hypothetical protein [Aerococcaceae bacterium zg-B36]